MSTLRPVPSTGQSVTRSEQSPGRPLRHLMHLRYRICLAETADLPMTADFASPAQVLSKWQSRNPRCPDRPRIDTVLSLHTHGLRDHHDSLVLDASCPAMLIYHLLRYWCLDIGPASG